MTQAIPRLPGWDHSLALLADPYRFIGRRCAALGSPVFETRLLLQRTLCLSGAEAARLFYDRDRFQRAGAAPEPLTATLFGKGAVQGLDGAAHRRRKALFLEATAPARVAALVDDVRQEWLDALPQWAAAGRVPLYRALQPVLARAVCRWAGVPLGHRDAARRTAQLVALFDGAASGVAAHLGSRWARRRAEHWLAGRIEQIRERQRKVPAGCAAEAVALHTDADGSRLAPRVAAVELLNLLRPVVAVSLYMTFVAHALHEHPHWADTLRHDDPRGPRALAFVEEVRRSYPFFPALAARVREPFEWRGLRFPAGVRTLLDLYGTDHDPRAWPEPDAFRPERWLDAPEPGFAFVPQGGADAAGHHRCPGEGTAVQLMLLALEMLLRRLHYAVPPQDLRIDFTRLPAVPRDGFVVAQVAPRSRGDPP